MARDPLHGPHAEIRQIAEEKGYRELHELDGMIVFPKDQDLQEDEDAVHGNGGCPHSQRRKKAQHIGNAGYGRSAEACLDGKGHAEGHDGQARKKEQIAL